MYLILMDCEGFGSLDQSENHDAKIFCLSVLISSLVIFNSMMTIDEKAIDSLALASELAHKVLNQGKRPETGITPGFVWLIRDFSLELRTGGKNGSAITEKDYMESKLSNSK